MMELWMRRQFASAYSAVAFACVVLGAFNLWACGCVGLLWLGVVFACVFGLLFLFVAVVVIGLLWGR